MKQCFSAENIQNAHNHYLSPFFALYPLNMLARLS
jgi:hypothetical protein